MLSDSLRLLLIADPGVSAIVGTAQTRADKKSGIYWVQLPEQALPPAIVFSTIAGSGTPTMDGADALHKARIQVSCYGQTYSDAKKLARAARSLLEGFSGALPPSPDGKLTQVDNVILVSEVDTFEDAPFEFHCPIDFEFLYSES